MNWILKKRIYVKRKTKINYNWLSSDQFIFSLFLNFSRHFMVRLSNILAISVVFWAYHFYTFLSRYFLCLLTVKLIILEIFFCHVAFTYEVFLLHCFFSCTHQFLSYFYHLFLHSLRYLKFQSFLVVLLTRCIPIVRINSFLINTSISIEIVFDSI